MRPTASTMTHERHLSWTIMPTSPLISVTGGGHAVTMPSRLSSFAGSPFAQRLARSDECAGAFAPISQTVNAGRSTPRRRKAEVTGAESTSPQPGHQGV